jgi:hypothetical protein
VLALKKPASTGEMNTIDVRADERVISVAFH